MREFLAFVLAALLVGAALVVLVSDKKLTNSGDRDEIRSEARFDRAEQPVTGE